MNKDLIRSIKVLIYYVEVYINTNIYCVKIKNIVKYCGKNMIWHYTLHLCGSMLDRVRAALHQR
jgi:hypothetical protein